MLDSVKIQRRQSEIRQNLAELVGKADLSEDETRCMDELDKEYRSNESRYRAALIAEDTERREAGEELETRSETEWRDLMGRFELRQVAFALDEGRKLDGATAEVVEEMRNAGGFQGVPVPFAALETRAGETVSTDTPDPVRTAPILDRLFASSVAAQMGVQMVNIDHGTNEYPVATQGAVVGWSASETGDVALPQAFQTVGKDLKPEQNLGCQMEVTRRALKQSGTALEGAIRRDMRAAIEQELDRVAFLGSGASGEPLGLIPGAATYGIEASAVAQNPTLLHFNREVAAFMAQNAANGPGSVSILMRPELWAYLASAEADAAGRSIYERLAASFGKTVTSANALEAPAGDPLASVAIMTTKAGGVAPAFVGLWGGIDLIRDPYSKAGSGILKLTGLVTADVTVARGVQSRILTDLQEA